MSEPMRKVLEQAADTANRDLVGTRLLYKPGRMDRTKLRANTSTHLQRMSCPIVCAA